MKTMHALVIAAGLAVAALVFGMFFYSARVTNDTIGVVGAATKRFESDIVKWRITLSRNTGLNNVSEGYTKIQDDLQFLRTQLVEKGFPEQELSIQPINTRSNWEEGKVSGYTVNQSIYLITANIAAVEELALKPAALVERGLVLENSDLEYFYSKLAEIKMELLAKATTDARRRAEEIANNAGVSLGNITNARTGVFQITEPFSTEVSDYGMYNTRTKQKDITVTVRASFKVR